MWPELSNGIVWYQPLLFHDAANSSSGDLISAFFEFHFDFTGTIIISADFKDGQYFGDERNFILRFFTGFEIVSASWDIKEFTQCWYRILMCIVSNDIYFRPMISAACFKIAFSINNCLLIFRSSSSSCSSGDRLSFSLKDPVDWAWLIHLFNKEPEISYSRMISHFRFPFK